MNKKELFQKKKEVARIFRSKCYVCERVFGRGFTFHHLYYTPDDKSYRDFPSNSAYQEYVLDVVVRNPKQFMLLCKRHHIALEWLKKYRKDTLRRLLKALKLSITSYKKIISMPPL